MTAAFALTLPLLLMAFAFGIAYRRRPAAPERPRIGTPAPLTSDPVRRAQQRREEWYLACASKAQAVAYHDADPQGKAQILRAWRLAQERSATERKRAALDLPPTTRGEP